MSVVTENNKNHLLDYKGVESLLVKINDRFARTDRYATQDTLGMIKAEVNTDVNSEDINIPDTTGDNYPVQVTTNGVAFVNIPTISEDNPDNPGSDYDSTYLKLSGGTLTGPLTTQYVAPSESETYDLGSSTKKYRTLNTKSVIATNLCPSKFFNAKPEVTEEDGTVRYPELWEAVLGDKPSDPISRQTFQTFCGSSAMDIGNNSKIGYAYSASMMYSHGDTYGYFSLPYTGTGRNLAYVGGGNRSGTGWSAKLFHNSMDLIPDANQTYKLGELGNQWSAIYTKYLYLNGTPEKTAGMLHSDENYMYFYQNSIAPLVIDATDTGNPYVRSSYGLAGKTTLGGYSTPWKTTYSLGYTIPDCTNEDILLGNGSYKNKKQLIPNLIGNGALTNALERDLTKFPATSTLFTSGWTSTGTNFATNYGTTLDISYSTWYQRLAFSTGGRIEYFRGINTNNSDNTVATLTKIGDLAYLSDIPTMPTKVSELQNDSKFITVNEGLYKTIYAGAKETADQGILVKTSVDETKNSMISVKITGNAYCANGVKPILTILEFYNYYSGGNSNPRIINISGTHFGADLGVIKLFNYDNKVCLWIPQTGNYQSFNVFANWTNSSGVDNNVNIVESLTKCEMLTDGVTYLVEFTPKQVSYKDEIVTTESNGLVPMADAAANTLSSQASDWVLAKKGSSIDWCKLPATAFSNTVTPRFVANCNDAIDSYTKLINPSIIAPMGSWYNVGATLYIKFTNGNTAVGTADNPFVLTDNRSTLQVYYKGSLITESNPLNIPAGTIVCFVVTQSGTSSSNPGIAEVVGMYETSSSGGSSEYLPLAGGTLTGNLYTSHIIPSDAGTPNIGTDSTRFGSGYFNNKVYAVNGFYEQSDENLKDFSTDIYCDLDKLSKLPKMYYRWKDDKNGVLHIGTSAQEVQKIYPELVTELEDGTLSVAYDKLSIVALKGIDLLNDKVKSLETRLEKLEKLINI
jgi:hypothetical protein